MSAPEVTAESLYDIRTGRKFKALDARERVASDINARRAGR